MTSHAAYFKARLMGHPVSVAQEKAVELVAVAERFADEIAERVAGCTCTHCSPDFQGMRVCRSCGSKRCAGAEDHRLVCVQVKP